jgi:hypothetical protein
MTSAPRSSALVAVNADRHERIASYGRREA